MNQNYLDFEQPIAELEAKIDELRLVGSDNDLNISEEISRLKDKCQKLIASTFSNLTPWQKAQLARHPQRPYTEDYIKLMVDDFEELHGDRHYADDPALVCGIGSIGGHNVAIIGHQKGRSVKEKVHRNFGMPRPEGYRKALRIMEMAERFKMPIITFIDTPGAYPGIGAEERGQSEAIAYNLAVMSRLKTPIIATVIGEGGSGGALAIGVCDHLQMLQNSTYSVISPEGCASILWKSATKAPDAAAAMGMTSERLFALGLIDQIIDEPLGGAHRNFEEIALSIKENLISKLAALKAIPTEKLVEERYNKLMSLGMVTR